MRPSTGTSPRSAPWSISARGGGMERTDRQKAGDAAECLVAERLAARGWLILARNVHAGRS